jgi:TM2 domain-containing membrane protein YozV
MKSKTTALILSILVGGLGVDRFYLGYTGMGILKLLTGGCFGVLYLIDIINIATGKLTPADGSRYNEDLIITSTPTQPTSNAYDNLATQASTQSVADELKKYKELFDQGVLTEEEFNAKKEQLLKLI